MKKAILLALSFVLLFGACSDDDKRFEPVLKPLLNELIFTNSANESTVVVVTNVSNWTATVLKGSDWCTATPIKNAIENELQIVVVPNTEKDVRQAEIELSGEGVMAKIVVKQSGRDTIYIPGNPGDIQNDIKMTVNSAEASNFQSSEPIEKSFDGDMKTIYHSSWSNTVFPITLEYRFEGVDQIDYLVYYPRASGSNGNFKEIEVWVSTAAVPSFTKYKAYDFQGSASPSKVDFDGGLKLPKAVKIIVSSGVGDNAIGFASCAEMEFYRKNTGNSIANIFADDVCSELVAGITLANIDTMSNAFYKNLARSLFFGDYPKEFRIQSFKAYPKPETKAAENKTSPYSLLDNPTGISVDIGEELIVFVGDTYGNNISLRIIDFSEGYDGESYPLFTGVNKLQMRKPGLAYVMYHTNNASASDIKIHIASGTVNAYFDITKHTANDWSKLLNEAKHNYFDVVGKYAHLTFPTKSFKDYTTNGLRLIQIYDSIAYLEQQFLGLEKYNRMNQNRMYFHVVYGDAYMYATSYRTAYHEGTLNELCKPNVLRSTSIWGPAHEVGHCNQTRPGFKWVGMTEVSNNLYSLHVQTSFGNKTRIWDEDLAGEGYTNRYEKAFTTLVAANAIHGTHNDVFCKLIPFWQLELYYSKIKGQTDFYKDVHEQVRVNANPANSGVAQLDFIKICSDIAQEDLRDFFTAWGMLTPVDADIEDYSVERLTCTQAQIDDVINYMKKYPKPSHSITYLHDNCLELYKTNKTIVVGTSSVSGNKFTFINWQNVVAYEVYDSSNNLVFVSPKPSFTTKSTVNTPTVYAVAANGSKVKVQL